MGESSVPEYAWFTEIPPDSPLRTRTQLNKTGKKPGGPVRGRVVWTRKRRVVAVYDLFDETEAIAKRPLTEAQRQAIENARRALRTCTDCGLVALQPLPRRLCAACGAARAAEAERARQAGLEEIARTWLRLSGAVVLDTETTSLDGYIIQIAIVDVTGRVLLDTLVQPNHPIEADARAVHGIQDEQLEGTPTFAELYPAITGLLHGRDVIVYNAAFDRRILANEVRRMVGDTGGDALSSETHASDWTQAIRWHCAMQLYSEWWGDWSEQYRSYRWQKLPGATHGALDDCRATLAVLRAMAERPA